VTERDAHHCLLATGHQRAAKARDLGAQSDPRRDGLQVVQDHRTVQLGEIRIRHSQRHRAVIRAIFQISADSLVLSVNDLCSEFESTSTTKRVDKVGVQVAVRRDLARDYRILLRWFYTLGTDVIHTESQAVRRHGAQSHFVGDVEVSAESLPQQQISALEIVRIKFLYSRMKILETARISGLSIHRLDAGNAWRILWPLGDHGEFVLLIDERLDDTHNDENIAA